MCEPIEIFEKNDSVYLIESFIDGDDAENALSAIELLFERKFYEDEFADAEKSE